MLSAYALRTGASKIILPYASRSRFVDMFCLAWSPRKEIGLAFRGLLVEFPVASDEGTLRKEKTYVGKLNLALVQVGLYPFVHVFARW